MNGTWHTSRRAIDYRHKTLVMGVLNVTPDSFSDGGTAITIDDALRRTDQMISDGADMIDIGGESTRPGAERATVADEIARVVPVIEAIVKRSDTPISVDTTRSEVAAAAVDAGAEIINDISGLRWDVAIADVAARSNTGLILMHLRGNFETMHQQYPETDILTDVSGGFTKTIERAVDRGIRKECIVLDVGIGFSKTQEQNLELLAKLGKLVDEFHDFPLLVGVSRKSFIGRVAGVKDPGERLPGSLAAAVVAIWNGASILRVHDVSETRQASAIVDSIRKFST
ncbi:MAG: dihydropteroate synthase [Acidobacteriota bacterium]